MPALWPFFASGLPQSADGAPHLLRMVALDHQVRQGMLYPRWSPELYTGLGYPVFNFYGPFSYYLAELLHLLGLDVVSALMAAFAVLVEEDLQSGQIVVELGWRALDRPSRDYTAFVHLVDQKQNMVTQSDQPPGGVDNPTHLWAPQEIIHSQFLLQLPAGIDPEGLVLRIGLYDPMSGARLLILDLAEGPATSPDGTYLQLSS